MAESNAPQTVNPPMRRDQQRALHAYKCVGAIKEAERKAYKTLVHGFGATILRSGLAAAMSELERKGGGRRPADMDWTADKRAVWLLRRHLAEGSIPHLDRASAEDLADKIRDLPAREYMLATREILQLVVWLKRAVQAIITE